MELRDYFAAEALNGLVHGTNFEDESDEAAGSPDYSGLARRAYAIADALIAERGPRGGLEDETVYFVSSGEIIG